MSEGGRGVGGAQLGAGGRGGRGRECAPGTGAVTTARPSSSSSFVLFPFLLFCCCEEQGPRSRTWAGRSNLRDSRTHFFIYHFISLFIYLCFFSVSFFICYFFSLLEGGPDQSHQ